MASEQALWDRWAKAKDAAAFEALVRDLERFAFDFARRVTGHDADAEDLAQEAFLELAEAEPSPVGVRAFVGRRIVLGAKMLRRAKLTRERHERAAAKGVEVHAEEGDSAREALALLDEEDRRAVELRFLHGLSYAEVAHVLGVTEPAARMRVHRALGSLRERLGPRAEAMLAALPVFLAPRSFAVQTARAAALAGGAVAVKKIVLVVVLLLAVAGGGVVASRAMRAAPPARAEEHPAVTVGEVTPPTDATPERKARVGTPAVTPPGKGSVFGRVAFNDGEPLRKTRLDLFGSASVGGSETDDEGRFRIDGQPSDVDRSLGVVDGKALFLKIADVKVSAAGPVEMDVALERGQTLEGVILRAGTPVADAALSLERPGARAAGVAQGSFGRGQTDTEGRFAFPFLPDGFYQLVVTRDGVEPRCVGIDVAPGLLPQVIAVKDARPLRLRFLPAADWSGKAVSFHIDNYGRTPILLFYRRTLDERGELTVDAPPPGHYAVSELPGGIREIVVTEAEVPDVVIDLRRGARVFGKASCRCGIQVGSAIARTDAEGKYEIDVVPAGEADVSVFIGEATLERPSVRVPESGELRLDLELRGVNVRGRLVADGESKGVTLQRAGEGICAQTRIGAEGNFVVPFVEPGEYLISGWTGEDPWGQPRSIAVGHEDLDVGDVVVEPGVDVAVIVVAPEGVQVAGSHSFAAWNDRSGGQLLSLSLDETGHGKVRLRPGHWRLSVRVGDLPEVSVNVDVPVREPVRFDLKR